MTTSEESIRRDQIEHGRRDTLHPKTGYQDAKLRPPFRGGGKPRSFAPAKPKGHDAILKAYQDSGAPIEVEMSSGDSYVGTVSARDKFTISLDTTEGTRVIYKHAIDSFGPYQARTTYTHPPAPETQQ